MCPRKRTQALGLCPCLSRLACFVGSPGSAWGLRQVGGGAQVGWRRVTRGWAGLGPHHQEGGEEGSRVPSLVRGGGGGVCPGLLQSLESVPSWLQGSETQEPKVNGGMPAGCAGSPRG